MPTLNAISPEEAIHRRWASLPSLVALIPNERIKTGDDQAERDETLDGTANEEPPELPCAKLSRTGNGVWFRSSSGRGDACALRLQVWHEKHSEGRAIVNAIYNAFDDQDWKDSGLTISCARIENDGALQEDDGVWQFFVDLQMSCQ